MFKSRRTGLQAMIEWTMSNSPAPKLVPPTEAIEISSGFPPGFYHVLREPAPLAGCAFPFGFHSWDNLHELGFKHVFCLSSERPRYSPSPLELTVACELDDLSWRKRPAKPKQEAEQIQFLAEILAQTLHSGEGCLVHCAAGRGRTGTVMGVALRMLGISADVIISHLNSLHQIRSGNPWPESPWQSAFVARDFELNA